MADEKISAMPAASPLDGTELIPVVQGGENRAATVSMLPSDTTTFLAVVGKFDFSQSVAAVGTYAPVLNVVQQTNGWVTGSLGDVSVPFDGVYHADLYMQPNNSLNGQYKAYLIDVVNGVNVAYCELATLASPPTVPSANASGLTLRLLKGFVLHLAVESDASFGNILQGRLDLFRLGGVFPPPPPPPPVYLLDLFVDADGTDITAHVMNIGPGWNFLSTTSSSSITIQGNLAQAVVNFSADTLAWTTAVTPNATETVDVEILSVNSCGGIVFRFVDLTHFWLAQVNLATGMIEVWKNVGGTFTEMASDTFAGTTGVTYHLRLRNSSDSITFDVDGGTPLNVVDSDLLGVANWGLYIGGSTSDSTINFGNFKVAPP